MKIYRIRNIKTGVIKNVMAIHYVNALLLHGDSLEEITIEEVLIQ